MVVGLATAACSSGTGPEGTGLVSIAFRASSSGGTAALVPDPGQEGKVAVRRSEAAAPGYGDHHELLSTPASTITAR